MNAGRALRVLLALAFLISVAWVGWRLNLFGVRSAPPFGSVARTFDDPLPYPGFVWTRNGAALQPGELNTIAGPDHCQWQTATLLHIGWPPGAVATELSGARQYIRDPKGRLSEVASLRGARFERSVTLPADAKPTGHKLGAIELYVSPSDQDQWIYLASPSDTERWPRSDPPIGCA